MHKHSDRRTDTHARTHTDKDTGIQKHRQTDTYCRHAVSQTVTNTHTHTDRHTDTDTHRRRHTEAHTVRHTHRHTD